MNEVLALYDCRSKQECIYRTNKIREIAGGSKLLANVYSLLINETCLNIENTWKDDTVSGKLFSKEEFAASGNDGVVIYEGGGNLFVLYKDKDTYINANRRFSRLLLERTYSISIIAACVPSTDNFNADRKALYVAKKHSKNLGTNSVICNVLPLTQTDRLTFMPLVGTDRFDRKLTAEAILKRREYKKHFSRNSELGTENLDSLVDEKGKDSILAVIYIDGNDMGNKIQKCTEGKNDYPGCIQALREFSLNTNEFFVNRPVKAIEKCLRKKNEADSEKIKTSPEKSHKYRLVVGGGDEITIICRGSDAKDIVQAYFNELSSTPALSSGTPNTSCAGIALFHSHAPFADVYEIAEQCCESGKKESHKPDNNGSYVDFHYCQSGITNLLDIIREKQEKPFTKKPYSLDELAEFTRIGTILKSAGRSNVKSLGESIVKGDSYYKFDIQRIRSRNFKGFNELTDQYNHDGDTLRKYIYDISVVFDLWFGGDNNV